MTTHVALLRGINVGGHNKVPMAELRALLEEQGFSEPHTLLQSGNVVFQGPAKDASALERQLEKATAERLGVTCDYHVRTAAQWQRLIAANPFPVEAESNPDHVLAMCFKTAPIPAAVADLQGSIAARRRVVRRLPGGGSLRQGRQAAARGVAGDQRAG